MNIVLWLVVGGGIGWIVNVVMDIEAPQGGLLDVGIGMAGALTSGLLLDPMLGVAPVPPGAFSLSGLVAALIGSIVLLSVVNLVRLAAAH